MEEEGVNPLEEAIEGVAGLDSLLPQTRSAPPYYDFTLCKPLTYAAYVLPHLQSR